MSKIVIREATTDDLELILSFIHGLADYEKLAHEVVATKESLSASLFCENPVAYVLIASYDEQPAGFALFFYNYSTFLAKKGLYLEDLFVTPALRGKKIGKALLSKLAKIAVEKECGRFEWSVLDWNKPAIDFYRSVGAVGLDGWTVQRLTGEALSNLAKLSE